MTKLNRSKNLQAIGIISPIVFMFLSIFVFRSSIEWFYALIAISIAVLSFVLYKLKPANLDKFAFILILIAAIGVSASTILTLEKIDLLKDPSFVTSCSFNPIVACSPVISSAQASAIDSLPNPFFGIFGFACLLGAGMTILAGTKKLSNLWWIVMFAGVCFGVVFSIWLMNQALYNIGALCLYCMSIWMISFALFWLIVDQLIINKVFPFNNKVTKFISNNIPTLITISIGIILILIYFRWSDYWNTLI